MKPKISVILPTYNRALVLNRAVSSVLKQSMQNFELLIIDDGSTDATPELLNGFNKHELIKVFRTKNRGVSRARNLGINQAQGEWIAFIDSDDEWLPQKLDQQLVELKSHPDCPLVHGDEIWVRHGMRVNPMKKHRKRGGRIYGDAVKLCCISPSTVLLKKDLFSEVGLFREDFPVCEDYDLWLKITAVYKVAYVANHLIKKYGGHVDQLSRRYKAMDYWRVLALWDRLSSGKLTNEQSGVTKREILKKTQILLRGFSKHENLENYDQIFSIQNELQHEN